jgi:hypothetical protein
MRIIALFLFSLLLLYGCKKEGVLEEERFVKIYSEILIAGDTTSVNLAKKDVFERYNISEEEYRATVDHYNKNPKDWDIFFNKVIAHIESLKNDSSSVH